MLYAVTVVHFRYSLEKGNRVQNGFRVGEREKKAKKLADGAYFSIR